MYFKGLLVSADRSDFYRFIEKEWLNMFVISRIILKDIQKLNIKTVVF